MGDRIVQRFATRHEQVRGENSHHRLRRDLLALPGINAVDLLDLIAKKHEAITKIRIG